MLKRLVQNTSRFIAVHYALAVVICVGLYFYTKFGLPTPVFATRHRAIFHFPIFTLTFFSIFTGIQLYLNAHIPDSKNKFRQYLLLDSVAALLWASAPLLLSLIRAIDMQSLIPPFFWSKMAQQGFDPANRIFIYGLAAFYILFLYWKSITLLHFLTTLRKDSWQIQQRVFLCIAGIFLLFSGLWFVADYVPTGDEPHYLLATHSLLYDGDFDLANNYAAHDYRGFRDTLDTQRGTHEPAMALLIAPAYALGGRYGVCLFFIFLAACTIWQCLLWLQDSLGNARLSLYGAGSILFLTPFCIFSAQVFPEIPAAFLTMLALRAIHTPRFETPSRLLLFFILILLLPILKTRFALLSASLVLYAFFYLQRYKWVFLMLLVGFVLCLCAIFYIDVHYLGTYAYWGKFLCVWHDLTGRYAPADYLRFTLAACFDRGVGLFTYAPVLIIGLFGLAPALKYNRTQALLVLQLMLVYFIIKSPYWQSGWSPPARYWIALLPPAALFIASAIGYFRSRPVHIVFAGLILLNFGIIYLLNVILPLRYSLENGQSLLFHVLSKVLHFSFDAYIPSFIHNRSVPSRLLLFCNLLLYGSILLGFLLPGRKPNEFLHLQKKDNSANI